MSNTNENKAPAQEPQKAPAKNGPTFSDWAAI